MRTTLGIFSIFLLAFWGSAAIAQQPKQESSIQKIVTSITEGNAGEIARYFDSMIDLSILGKEDSYSKTQATRVLKGFYAKYPVTEFKLTKEGSSNDGSHFVIGTMKSGSVHFRIYCLMKKSGGTYLIQQFQVQD
jgi:hypothetical protein